MKYALAIAKWLEHWGCSSIKVSDAMIVIVLLKRLGGVMVQHSCSNDYAICKNWVRVPPINSRVFPL